MSVKAANNRFIVSSTKYAALYQQLFCSFSDFQALGQWLIASAETAQNFRQTDRLEELGRVLSYSPFQEHRHIGNYYLAWCAYRKGENAQKVFEEVVEKSATYKAKGLISLAAVTSVSGDYHLGSKYYAEAVRIDASPSIIVPAARSLAVIKSMEGSHKSALVDLERIAPLARHASPKIYFDYLNSLAVELLEADRVDEAQNISNIVLASPYAPAFPEWRETGNEISLRGYRQPRSVVSFCQTARPENVVHMPGRGLGPDPVAPPPLLVPAASVTSLRDWKKTAKESNDDPQNVKTSENMTEKEMFLRAMELFSDTRISTKKRRKMLELIEQVASQPEED